MIEKGKNRTLKEIIKSLAALFGGYDDVHDGDDAQAIKNLAMDLEEAGCRARYLIRDRDGKIPALMDEILAEASIKTVLTGIRMPRMNSSSAASSGTNATCGTPYASTNCATTSTEPIKPWTKPPRCVPSPTRSQTPSESPT
ncbi:hypothetical protein ACGFNP_46960 [Nonomuraea sp. NPDC049269]|uniref:hypothetical protein n=1 Tax=Nonomuraea sp. NPDC049269 TaxID=3364349 RepID=UPI0037202B5C